MRDSYRTGIKLLLDKQKELGRPPKRELIRVFVTQLVIASELGGDKRESYFRLLATCALMGLEPMYNNYNKRRK